MMRTRWLTKQEAIDGHRKMWNWIADETEKRRKVVTKRAYFEELQVPVPIRGCYCCDYANDRCSNCPIQWTLSNDGPDNALFYCRSTTAEFEAWFDAKNRKDWQEAAKWARIIAELPSQKNPMLL